jgi:ferric-dicitrate binding protein FerR (iron transport regulator)
MTDDLHADHPLGPVLARYVSGEASPADADHVHAWLAADPDPPSRQTALDELRQVWALTGRLPAGWNVNAAWDALVARRRAADVSGDRARTALRVVPSRPIPVRRWSAARPAAARIAAGLLLALAGGAVWRVAGRPEGPPPATVVATVAGQRTTLVLGDGSRVVLAPASRLRHPPDFGAHERNVYLEGEAYFTVTHDTTRPFRVYAAGAVAEDLGTEFAVRAYPGDPHVRVVVAGGAVELRAAAASPSGGTVLTRGQRGRLAPDGTVAVTDGVALDEYTGWTEGRLAFRDTPLAEVLADLNRWHDVRFDLADSALATRGLTASFSSASLPDALRALATNANVLHERRGSVIRLHPGPPPPAAPPTR